MLEEIVPLILISDFTIIFKLFMFELVSYFYEVLSYIIYR